MYLCIPNIRMLISPSVATFSKAHPKNWRQKAHIAMKETSAMPGFSSFLCTFVHHYMSMLQCSYAGGNPNFFFVHACSLWGTRMHVFCNIGLFLFRSGIASPMCIWPEKTSAQHSTWHNACLNRGMNLHMPPKWDHWCLRAPTTPQVSLPYINSSKWTDFS